MLKSGRRWPANKFLMTSRQSYSVSELVFWRRCFSTVCCWTEYSDSSCLSKTSLVLNFWSHCWSMCPLMSRSCIVRWRKLPRMTCRREMKLLQLVDCGLHLSQRTLGFFFRCGDQGCQYIAQHLNRYYYCVDTQ